MTHRMMLTTILALLPLLGACEDGPPPMTCRFLGTPEQVAARPSPADSAMIAFDSAQAKFCYSRPSVRGRVVFGDLVPYDTLWRTGANEATVLHISEAATVAGVDLEEGDYSIYTVPSPNGWTLVLNESTSQWGLTREERGAEGNLFPNAYTDEVRDQEVARVPVQVDTIPFVETLTASFENLGPRRAELHIDWEELRIVIPLTFRQGS